MMSDEYIPVATAETIYYKPQTEQEMEQMTAIMKVGDMILASGCLSLEVCGTQWD